MHHRSTSTHTHSVARSSTARSPLLARLHDEQGDVPGWVMITLMSAVLVAGLLAVAQPALEGLFNDAISNVSQ